MVDIIDGVCVFAELLWPANCTLKQEVLGCGGMVDRCPIPKEKEEAVATMFDEMDLEEE